MENKKTGTHTPGPWNVTVSISSGEVWLNGAPDGSGLQSQIVLLNGVSRSNARLIAAAPELLEALVIALDEIRQGMDYDGPNAYPFTKRTVDIARAAR